MGWESSDRRDRLPVGWARRRAQVLRDCGHVCEYAGCQERATEVDHIVRNSDDSRRNLQGLCREHHARKSSFEGNLEQARRRALRVRPVGRHPGSLVG